jgi:ABC-type transport system involved in cytochrome c biogenesis permease component
MLATILWIGFILVQLLYGPLWFKEDNHSDCLFDLYIAGVSPRSIIIVKFGFYCIVQWGTFSVCFLLAAMSLGLTKPFIKILEITLFIAIPIISSILMVLNLTLIKVQHSFSLLALLLFPLILPTSIVVLMAIKAFSQGWGEESFHYFIIAEIGLFLLTIPSCFLCATYLLRETLETI